MSLYKTNDAVGSLALGMSYAEAKEMVENEGYMLEYLPKVFQTDELRKISYKWWEDRFLRFYDHVCSHPEEVTAMMSQAKVAGSQILVGEDLKFDVSLDEID